MNKSRLILILKTFSKEELKDFRKFVDSPFFNKEGKYVLRFYDELKKYYPDFENKNLEKKNLFKILYPGKIFSDSLFRKLSSVLQNLAEEYLNLLYFNNSGYLKEIINLQMLRERRITGLFELKSAELNKLYNEHKENIDMDFFRNRFKHELEKINYYMDSNSFVKQQQQSLQDIQNYIIYDSLLSILDIAYNIHIGLSSMYSGKTNIVIQFLEKLDLNSAAEILKKDTPSLYPIFELFYLRYLSFLDFDNETYTRYKKSAFKNLKFYNRENQFTILVSLQNFCITKFVKGDKKFLDELHSIHKEMVKRDLLINKQNGFINLSSYRNIILTAQSIGNLAWMEKFINKYEKNILPEQRESLSAWAMASLYYEKRKLNEALKKLQNVKNDHFLTKHDIKILMLKIFFEQEEYETAISFADTYRHMVENDKTYSEMHRNSHRSFAVFYSRFVKLVANKNFYELQYLKPEIEKSVTNSKEWLLNQISKFNKKSDRLKI